MKTRIIDALAVGGLLAIVAGIGLLSIPSAVIVLGVFLLLVGAALALVAGSK